MIDLANKDWHTLRIPEGRSAEYRLRHRKMDAGAQLDTSSLRTQVFGQRNTKLTFEGATRWHELSYDGGVWMTDLPIEQVQMDAAIDGFEGDVLVGGLGLGYCVQALLAKPEVKTVTVVEVSSDVVKLVWDHLDKGDDPDRLPVLFTDDLHRWLGSALPAHYDFCLFDIWQSDGEATFWEQVVPLRKLVHERGLCDDANVACWNEDIMRGQLGTALASRLHFAIDDQLRELHGKLSDREAEAKAPPNLPTIEQLAVLRSNRYTDWSVPFFHALHTGRLDLDADDLDEIGGWFVENVGRPGFDASWESCLQSVEASR